MPYGIYRAFEQKTFATREVRLVGQPQITIAALITGYRRFRQVTESFA
jgi:hypothetical protein